MIALSTSIGSVGVICSFSLSLVLGYRCFMGFHFYLRIQPIIFAIVYNHARSTKFNLIHRFKKEHNSVCPSRRKETFTTEIKNNTRHERIGQKITCFLLFILLSAILLEVILHLPPILLLCISKNFHLVIEHGLAHILFDEYHCFLYLLPPPSANQISNSRQSIMNLT